MDGNPQLQAKNTKDFTDPFNAGQMVGMMVILMFIERNGDLTEDMIDKIKQVCVDNVQVFFDKPAEDIFLMIDNMVNDIGRL